MFRLYHVNVAYRIKNEDWIKRQQFNYNSNLLILKSNQLGRCQFNDRNVLTRLVIPVMFVFAPLSLTRVSGVDDNFI